MDSVRVAIDSGAGYELVGRLETPTGAAPRATLIYANCFTCIKDLKCARRVSHRLVTHGFGVLRFDYSGIGESGGRFEDVTFSRKVQDVAAAAAYLRQLQQGPVALMGHSLGGLVAIFAAREIESVRLVATINAPAEAHHLADQIERRAPHVHAAGPAELSFAGGKSVRVGSPLVRDLRAQDSRAALARLNRPLLIFHAVDDEIVPLAAGRRLFAHAGEQASLVLIPDADHLLVRHPRHANFVADVTGSWLRNLDSQAPTVPRA